MREVPNNIVQNLIRHLPLILDNIDTVALRNNTRLSNAVRLMRILIKKLKHIELNG